MLSDKSMPESIIQATAPLVVDHFTGLMQSIPAWFKAIIGLCGTAFGSLQGYFFWKGNKNADDIVSLRIKHDEDMKKSLERCAAIHEREYSRSTDFATKGDVQTINNKIDVLSENIQAINNNVATIAMAIHK